MTKFMMLYKLDSHGKIRQWYVIANDIPGTYLVTHGLLDGQQQETRVKCEGKNIGRANETTKEEQAYSEAQSKWNKQKDKGYREEYSLNSNSNAYKTTIQNLKDAKAYMPMLAHKFSDHKDKVMYPCYGQPKLDGLRCLAYINPYSGSDIFLQSRKGKFFANLSHIRNEVGKILSNTPSVVLDGELYSSQITFQTIASITRTAKKVHPDEQKIEYHIYDCFRTNNSQLSYKERKDILDKLLSGAHKPIVKVPTHVIAAPYQVPQALKKFEDAGFEGLIIRNAGGIYKHDRSSDLLKVKNFIDEEFEIVGGKPGVGKFENFCTFICVTEEGKEFGVTPMGTDAQREEYLTNLDDYIGKQLTVRYFERTDDNIPRFPVGVEVRDYE